jgi:hypothetical protein
MCDPALDVHQELTVPNPCFLTARLCKGSGQEMWDLKLDACNGEVAAFIEQHGF